MINATRKLRRQVVDPLRGHCSDQSPRVPELFYLLLLESFFAAPALAFACLKSSEASCHFGLLCNRLPRSSLYTTWVSLTARFASANLGSNLRNLSRTSAILTRSPVSSASW